MSKTPIVLRELDCDVGQGRRHRIKVSCTWMLQDPDYAEHYKTSCGAAFTFHESGPIENGMVYCYRCGKRIKEAGK